MKFLTPYYDHSKISSGDIIQIDKNYYMVNSPNHSLIEESNVGSIMVQNDNSNNGLVSA